MADGMAGSIAEGGGIVSMRMVGVPAEMHIQFVLRVTCCATAEHHARLFGVLLLKWDACLHVLGD